jgi:hypothetical protein
MSEKLSFAQRMKESGRRVYNNFVTSESAYRERANERTARQIAGRIALSAIAIVAPIATGKAIYEKGVSDGRNKVKQQLEVSDMSPVVQQSRSNFLGGLGEARSGDYPDYTLTEGSPIEQPTPIIPEAPAESSATTTTTTP